MGKKVKLRFLFVCCIWLPLLLCAACEIFITGTGTREPNKPVPEKKYQAETLWDREIFGDSFSTPLIEGQYCYLPVHSYGDGPYLVKTNMETGKVMWESERVQGYDPGGNPQKIGDYVYQQFDKGYILALNDSDGTLAATITIGETEVEAKDHAGRSLYQCAVLDKYLYWGNFAYLQDMKNGLMRLDTTAINFDTDPYIVQVIIPELVWSKSWATYIDTNIIAENRIIYFLTNIYTDRTSRGHTPVLVAFDTEAGNVIWDKEMPRHDSENYASLVINGNNLFIAEYYLSCFDKSNGDLVYEISGIGNETVNWYGASSITPHNNFLYCNNHEKIIAINSITGDFVWSKSIYSHYKNYSESHYYYSYPQVHGETLYVASDTGLRVYNATNGNFIGVDNSVKASHSIMHNDTLVFIGNGYMTAIKCQ